METFNIRYSGDFLDEKGDVANGYLGEGIYSDVPYIKYDFLMDQAPQMGDQTYKDRLYSLTIEPHHLVGTNGLVIIRPYVKRSTFAQGAESLVAIGRAGVGVDKIDLQACTENDVVVFNAPGTLTHSTASAAMLFILALAKKLPQQEKMARTGDWSEQAGVTGDDLVGQTLGLIGLGRIALELVRLLAPFKMNVIAYDPYIDQSKAQEANVKLIDDIDTLLRESDYVSMHCLLNDDTRGMIGEREFRLMQPTAYFINVGRGELVRQTALVKALQEGWIAGAGLDVFEHEPLPADDPLTELNNVILSPHWLPTTHKVVKDVMNMVSAEMCRISQGKLPDNVVNPEVLSRSGFQKKLKRYAINAI